jgi:hypothetical protein
MNKLHRFLYQLSWISKPGSLFNSKRLLYFPGGFFILMLCINSIQAQHTFVATYGNGAYNEGVATILMNDSTYMVIGNSSGHHTTSAPYFALIDHQGGLIRDWMLPRQKLLTVTAAAMHDSVLWMIGYAYNLGTYDNMLIRMTASGLVLTEVYWGHGGWNFPRALVVTHPDTAFIAGEKTDTLFGAKNAILICIDSLGIVQWEQQFGGADEDAFLAIDTTHNNTLIMAGYTKSIGQYADSALFVVHTDRQGDPLWQTIEDYSGPDMATGIRADLAGGYILCGQSSFWVDYGKEAFIMRLDTAGTPVWKTRLGSEDETAFYDIIQRPDHSYRMAGFYSGTMSLGKKEFYMQNCQSNGWWGPLLGGFIHGGKDDDIARHITPTSDGGYLVTGTTRSFGPGISHIMVMKTDSAGTVLINLGHQTSIEKIGVQTPTFSVFPNPVRDVLEVRFQSPPSGPNQTFTILDMSGRVLRRFPGTINQQHAVSIPVHSLSSGIYILQVGVHLQKFIKY